MAKQLRPELAVEDVVKPVEPQGVVRGITNQALGAFASLGNLLDLPGSSVRDLLAFKNPLDQWLTPFEPDNRTTGGDLLRGWGMVGKENTWGNLPARLAVEFALDPMTYLTFGTGAALTSAGKAAKATGALALAADVATARATARAAGEVAPLAAKGLQAATADLMPKLGTPAAEALAKAGLERSTAATVSVGPRMAKKTLSLNDLIEGLPKDVLPFGNKGATSLGQSVSRETILKNLEDYAKKLDYRDAQDFLRRHGEEKLAMDASLGLPFAGNRVPFSLGRTGDSISRHLDLAESAVRWSLPGRAISMLFDTPSGNQLSRQGQEISKGVYERRKVFERHAAKEAYDRIQDLESIVPDFNATFGNDAFHLPGKATAEYSIDSLDRARDALGRIVRFASEVTDQSAQSAGFSNSLQRAVATLLPGGGTAKLPGEMAKKLESLIGTLRDVKNAGYADWVDGGGTAGLIDFEWLSHFPRYAVPKNFTEDFAFRSRAVPSAGVATASREKALAAIPAEVIHTVLNDDLARHGKLPKEIADAVAATGAPAPKFGRERVKELIKDWTGDIEIDLPDGTKKIVSIDDQADQLFDYARSASKDFLQDRRMYANSPMEDYAKHLTSMYRLIATRDAAYTTLLRSADDLAKMPGYAGPTETIGETLRLAGYQPELASVRMGKMAGNMNLAPEILGRSVPKEVADAITAINMKSVSPLWMKAIAFYWDKATRILKENLTLPFPAFWVRNFLSGQAMNMMANHVETPADIGRYFENFKLANQIRKNPEKYRDYIRELHSMDVYRYGYHSADMPEYAKLTQVAPLPVFDYPSIRREAIDTVAERGSTAVESALSRFPSAQANVGKVMTPLREAHQTVLETGRRISAMGEWYNRVPMYLYLREKGYAPEVASQIVKDIHVDYADLTGFEKGFARRAALFYTFSRKQLEQTAKRIFEQPGGIPGLSIAATIKAVNRAREPGELLPDYVAETASIPLGMDELGNRSFLTGLGLAFEDPMQFFGKGLRGAGTELISRLNPMIKGPAEYIANESFFQSGPGGGRDLPDADPLLGRALANITGRDVPYKFPELVEVGLANSPASRLISSARQLFDPRRTMLESASNLATGFRTTIVSPAASDAILRERINEQLRSMGGRQFISAYVPEAYKAKMTPGDLASVEQLTGTLNELARRTKARKSLREEGRLPK